MSVKIRFKKLAKGSKSVYLDVYTKGLRHTEFLNIKIEKNDPNKKQKMEIAEAKRSKRELEIYADYNDVPRSFNGEEDFLEYFKEKADKEVKRSVLSNFKEFIAGKTVKGKLPFRLLSEKLFENFREYLEERYKNSTAWVYMLNINTVLNQAVKDKKIIKNPAKYEKVKLLDIDKVYLTETELEKMAETDFPDKELKRAFMFSCFTGLRFSDIKQLTWSQIQEGKLIFRQKKTKGLEYLPLAETAIAYLYLNIDRDEIKPDEKIFKISKNETVNIQLREWAKLAKINKYLTFHTARHTFATMSLNSGNELAVVSKMMGHSSVKMTEIYAKIINKTVDEAVTKLPKFKNVK